MWIVKKATDEQIRRAIEQIRRAVQSLQASQSFRTQTERRNDTEVKGY